MPINRAALTDAAQAAALDVALRFSRHPGLQWKRLELRYKNQMDPDQTGAKYGINSATIRRMEEQGLDFPGYRFYRDAAFYEYFADKPELFGASWLDVGADTGAVDQYLSEMLRSDRFQLCDIAIARKHAGRVELFDGRTLKYPDKSFDLVFFSYVLHHAADDTIPLLQEARRVASRYVVVLEDPKETPKDYYWAYKHDRKATFRGLAEWRLLFSILGFSVAHDAPLSNDIHSRHMFVLRT